MDLRNMTETELNKGALLFVRLGITIQSICDIVKAERARLWHTYNAIAEGSVIDLVQGIEEILAQYVGG